MTRIMPESQDRAEQIPHPAEIIPDRRMSDELLDDLLPERVSAASIKDALDHVVVGQEQAKLSLSVLLSAHVSALRGPQQERSSPNAFLVGPTGVGKTHTIRTAADYLAIPFVNVDVTSLVPTSGGTDLNTVETVLTELMTSAETLLAKTNTFAEVSTADMCQRGLIFLDEIDKIRARPDGKFDAEWNLRVQRRLLRLIEGTFTKIREMRGETLDTSKILFLAGGTFDGIHDPAVVSKRPAHLARMLRNPENVISADLITYGFLPELVARLPVLIDFVNLSSQDLVAIMNNDEVDPSLLWRRHFASMGKTLEISNEAKELIADRAERLNMGARGLHQVLFPMLARLAYDFESSAKSSLILTGAICERELTHGW
jgi:ATP-dependent Clp protease ATP-binding subunit ClpX